MGTIATAYQGLLLLQICSLTRTHTNERVIDLLRERDGQNQREKDRKRPQSYRRLSLYTHTNTASLESRSLGTYSPFANLLLQIEHLFGFLHEALLAQLQ